MTAVSSGTDVASTSGAAVDGSMPGRHGCRLVGCPIGERPPLRPPLTWRRPRGVLISAAVPRQASAARPRRSLAATYPHGRLRGAIIPAAVPWRSVAAPSPLIRADTSPHGRPRGALIPRAGRPRLIRGNISPRPSARGADCRPPPLIRGLVRNGGSRSPSPPLVRGDVPKRPSAPGADPRSHPVAATPPNSSAETCPHGRLHEHRLPRPSRGLVRGGGTTGRGHDRRHLSPSATPLPHLR